MDVSETRHLARRAIELLGSRQLPALFELIHEDGTWAVPFDTDRFPFGGCWGKEDMRAVLTNFQSGFDRFQIAVTNVVAEPGVASVEAIGHGEGPGEAKYKNVFHFALECDGGKIRTIREYFNPIEVVAYIEQLGPVASQALAGATAASA